MNVARIFGTLAIGACTAMAALGGGSLAQAAGVSSTWSTDFGTLHLSVDDGLAVGGDYPQYNGSISGRMTVGGRITAYWLQKSSERRCSRKIYGTRYWGVVVWQVQDNGDLRGQWAYCEDRVGSGGTWSGRLTRGASPMTLVGGGRTSSGSLGKSSSGSAGSSSRSEPDEPIDAIINLLDALSRQ